MEKIEHGTIKAYAVHRCRCEKCKAANAERMREYFRKNPGVNARLQKAKKQNKKALGLCADCDTPCVNTVRCAQCIRRARGLRAPVKVQDFGPLRLYFSSRVVSILLPEDWFYLANN